MKVLRTTLNYLIDRTYNNFDSITDNEISAFYRYIVLLSQLIGRPIPKTIQPKTLRLVTDILSDAIRNTPYDEPLRLRLPLIATVSTSNYCPFECLTCYSDSSGEEKVALTQARKEVVADLCETKIPFVILTGGEPTSSPKFVDECGKFISHGKLVFVATNASIRKYKEFIQEYNGMFYFIFSVWSHRERHNEIRGKGSYERIEDNLGFLNQLGVKAYLNVFLNDDDMRVFDDVQALASKFEIELITITRKIYVGRFENQTHNLTSEYLEKVISNGLRLKKFARQVVFDLPEARRSLHTSMIQSALGIKPHQTCAAGAWMVHIDEHGAYSPCFTFEKNVKYTASRAFSALEKWEHVQAIVSRLPSTKGCVGELCSGACKHE